MASSSDAASKAAGGLLAKAAVKKTDEPKEKRHMLKNVDVVATKCLDPYGLSVIDEVPLKKLWKIVSKGDRFAKFFCELAATPENCPDPAKRVGIGISRFCETMANAIDQWKAHTQLRAMMKPEVVKKVDAEADLLLPHLKAINAGKGTFVVDKYDTFKGFKEDRKRKLSEVSAPAIPTNEALQTAVDALWKFLEDDTTSNLRAAFAYLSTGGVFYAAHTFDKTIRAWKEHCTPKPTKEKALECVVARHGALGEPEEEVAHSRETFTGNLLAD
jgi:hypothetical protein